MPIKFHHVHLKARDPEKTAAWYEQAFGFKVTEKTTRPTGDVFVICQTTDGTTMVISGEKNGEALARGSAGTHFGLEHFAMATDDFDGDLARLQSLGGLLLDGPTTTAAGIRFAFIQAPDDVRIELMFFPAR